MNGEVRLAVGSHPQYNQMAAPGISCSVETISTHPALESVRPMISMTAEEQHQPSDEDLVRRACRGDVQAFEQLYRDNVGRIYPLCLRMCANADLAEEMVQETFIRAWQKLGTFRGASAFSTWLHRVAVNVVLGNRRSGARRAARFEPMGERPLDVEGKEERPGRSLDLERAVANLPTKAREIFVLHDVEGYRHKEIADIAGVAVGTSKAQLHRARKLLRKALS